MAENKQNNKTYISGEIASESVFSHESYGEKFYECKVRIARLSGTHDTLPVVISERIMPKDWAEGKTIHALGQFRSYNKIIDGKSRLQLYVFILELLDAPKGDKTNIVALAGYICKKPTYRTTPFNREIADVLIAVNRAYNKSDYIPAIAWGRNARFVSSLSTGDRVQILGRIQSREYEKTLADGNKESRTAYEVSISQIMATDDENGLKLWEDAKCRAFTGDFITPPPLSSGYRRRSRRRPSFCKVRASRFRERERVRLAASLRICLPVP